MTLSIAIRVDASIDIGTGHVMRCLTLANALRASCARVRFICRPHPGHLMELIRQHGHEVDALPPPKASTPPALGADHSLPVHANWLGDSWREDATQTITLLGTSIVDWLIVDHYALDRNWEVKLRPHCRQLMVIDDLADRTHDCALLLDQNLGRTIHDYAGLVSPHCRKLIGPEYALLRPEFSALRPYSLMRRKSAEFQRLLITMGGVDKDNVTGQVLDELRVSPLPRALQVTVVMGPHAPWLQHVRTQAERMPCTTQVLVGVNNMAQLMAEADLAIGAAGGSALERCCLGLPTITLVLAANQKTGGQALQKCGATLTLNCLTELRQIMHQLISSNGAVMYLRTMSSAAQQITSGQGSTVLMQYLLENHV